MHIRTGLVITSLVCGSLSLGSGALVGCSSSSTNTSGSDSGAPKSDSSVGDTGTKSDAGTKTDTGGGTPDTGTKADTGGGGAPDTGTTPDAGIDAGPADSGVAKPTDADIAACAASAQAVCTLQGTCDIVGQVIDYGDAGTCLKRQRTLCELALVTPGIAKTPASTTACATAQATETCAAYVDLSPPDACAPQLGTSANGVSCSHPSECSSGFCALPNDSVCGQCATAPVAGDSCTNLATCGPTLDCVQGKCTAYVTTDGGTCSESAPCGAGLYCVSTPATCQTAGATVGAPCDPTGKTRAGCDSDLGLYCDDATSLCAAVAYAAGGAPCDFVGGVKTYCSNGTCYKNTTVDAGHACIAHAADKAACNTLTGPGCILPARCVGTALDGGSSGTCKLPATSCP